MWILSVVLAGVVLVSFAWGSVFYLRFATQRDWRKLQSVFPEDT